MDPVYRSRRPLLSRGFLAAESPVGSTLARRSGAEPVRHFDGHGPIGDALDLRGLPAALDEERSRAVVLPALDRARQRRR